MQIMDFSVTIGFPPIGALKQKNEEQILEEGENGEHLDDIYDEVWSIAL
jgi:hypothetical protein